MPRYECTMIEIRALYRPQASHAVTRSRSSLRRPTRASRTSLCAESMTGIDCAQEDALRSRDTAQTACKRAQAAHAEQRSCRDSGFGALIAHCRTQTTVAVSLTVASMRLLAEVAAVSTCQAAVGDRVARAAAGGCWRSACHRAGSGRTKAHASTNGALFRKIVWPMCSRLSLECEEPSFTVAVKKVAHL